MQSSNTDFQAGFEFLGLSTNPSGHYENAREYSKRFKKCSALAEVNVSYSSHSAGADPKAEADAVPSK